MLLIDESQYNLLKSGAKIGGEAEVEPPRPATPTPTVESVEPQADETNREGPTVEGGEERGAERGVTVKIEKKCVVLFKQI